MLGLLYLNFTDLRTTTPGPSGNGRVFCIGGMEKSLGSELVSKMTWI
jgi:hypothetical protein